MGDTAMFNEENERYELYVSEEDARREPLAAALAEMLIHSGQIVRVDPRGRAVDENGEYTEGEWNPAREQYYPNEPKQDVQAANSVKFTSPTEVEDNPDDIEKVDAGTVSKTPPNTTNTRQTQTLPTSTTAKAATPKAGAK